MFRHNFRTEDFQGNLLQLLEICNPHLALCRESFMTAAKWIEERIDANNEILPVRKHSSFSKRGAIITEGGKEFVSVDNELLAGLLCTWMADGYNAPNCSLKSMIMARELPLSWKIDVPFAYNRELKGSPVRSDFRDCGLKIAHILPAGMEMNSNYVLRYLRTLHPFNVFFFPSSKIVSFDSPTFKARVLDWAEDEKIQEIAWGYLCHALNLSENQIDQIGKKIGGLKTPNRWKEEAENISVTIVRRSHKIADQQSRKAPQRNNFNPEITANVRQSPDTATHCKKGFVKNMDEFIGCLSDWVATSDGAVQLNGSRVNQSSPGAWIQFEVNGFNSPIDDFTTRHDGITFSGESYNGCYFLPGDFKREAAIKLLEIAENAENFCDLFHTSATHETRNVAPQNGQKRSLVLKDYRGLPVDGCYIYKKNQN